jgi:hypothetical protein
MTCLSSCDQKAEEAPQASKPAAETSQVSWRDWIAKSTDPTWWKEQWSQASEAAKAAKRSLDALKAEELKKQASDLLKAIEDMKLTEVESLAAELSKHLTVEKLGDGLKFIILQRQQGGEAATKAIEAYAARTDLNDYERAAAQNLKKGLETLQRDDVRGGIVCAVIFACECKFGSHEGALIGGLIVSILFPDFHPPDTKP